MWFSPLLFFVTVESLRPQSLWKYYITIMKSSLLVWSMHLQFFARTFLPMWESTQSTGWLSWMSKKTAQVIIRKGNRGHNWTSMFYLPNTGQHFKSRAKQRTLTLSFTDAGMQTCSLKKLTGRSTTVTVCNFRRKFLEADCHSKKHKSTDPSTVTLLNGRSRLPTSNLSEFIPKNGRITHLPYCSWISSIEQGMHSKEIT